MADTATAAAAAASPVRLKKPYEASAMPARTFLQNVHIFRAVAILMIICAHTVPSFDWSDWPTFGRVVDTICNQASIYFFFIAGFLFQFLSPRYETRRYLKQKFRTVIMPYLIMSVPALLVFTLVTQREGVWSWFYDLAIWEQIGLFLLTGKHLAPLWFVPTITLFYLAAPLLVRGDRARWMYFLILPLFVISILYSRDGPLGPIDKARYLAAAYLFGMFWSHFYDRLEAWARRWWPLLFSIGAVGFALVLWNDKADLPYDFQMVQKLAWAPVFLVALDAIKYRVGTRLDYIAEVSFGIFFVHAYFIAAFKVAYTYALTDELGGGSEAAILPGTPIFFLGYVALVLIFSLALIRLSQLTFKRNSRMVVGA